MKPALILALALALAACKTETATRDPVTMPEDAIAYDCQMYMIDHAGPKAQVLLEGYKEPFWFSQVSAAMAFLNGPEKIAPVQAVFVSDMSRAKSWGEPGADNWIPAATAHFVIDSDQIGGMGTPEAISFATEDEAAAYQKDHGGQIVAFDAVPADYLKPTLDSFVPGDEVGSHEHHHEHNEDSHADDHQALGN
jgi:copper chaperone NosL